MWSYHYVWTTYASGFYNALHDLRYADQISDAYGGHQSLLIVGISILYAKPHKEPPDLFSFMSPLSLQVWLYMATAYLCISVLLFFLAKYNGMTFFDGSFKTLIVISNSQNCGGRLGKSPSLQYWSRWIGNHLEYAQLHLVNSWIDHAAGLWHSTQVSGTDIFRSNKVHWSIHINPQSNFYASNGWSVVVLCSDCHFVLHS